MKLFLFSPLLGLLFASAVAADDVASQVIVAATETLPAIPPKHSMVVVDFVQQSATTARLQVTIGANAARVLSAESSEAVQTQRNLRIASGATAVVNGASSTNPVFITYRIVED